MMTLYLTREEEELLDRIIGRRLQHLRESAMMTTEELVLLTGISADEWAEHESGVMPIPLSRMRTIAAVFDLQPAELLARLIFSGC